MQTIDNIKKGLKCFAQDRSYMLPCSDCDYHGQGKPPCRKAVHEDALALIEQMDAERDAAVRDMYEAQGLLCLICKNFCPDPEVKKYRCKVFGERFPADGIIICGKFEWRGAKMDAKDNDAPTKPETHRPEDCVNYATRTRDGRAVCLGTRELDPCDGAGCKRWKAKKNGGTEDED